MKKFLFAIVCIFLITICKAQTKGNPQPLSGVKPLHFLRMASKLNPDLRGLYKKYNPSLQKEDTTAHELPFNDATENIMQIKGNKVLVNFTVEKNSEAARAELQKMGVNVTGAYGHVVSGYVTFNALHQIESTTANIRYAKPSYKPLHSPVTDRNHRAPLPISDLFHLPPFLKNGPVISQGDTAQLSYKARSDYHVNGNGVKVGILSDSYNNLGSAGKGVLHGELPGFFNPYGFRKPVEVIKDRDSGGTDEGRAMAEIVHDVAPGAGIAFYTAFDGEADFAEGIQRLAENGCKVICDDTYYTEEPFFQDGIIAQSVDKVKAQGVTYFSSAGNQANYSYENTYRPSAFAPFGTHYGTAHDFSAPGNAPLYFQPLYLPPGAQMYLSFQWDQPFYSVSGVGATTDFDIYLLDMNGNVVAGSTSDNLKSGDPLEEFEFYNKTPNNTFYVAILKVAGPDANILKYVMFDYGDFFPTTPPVPGIYASSLFGHNKAAGAISTGAAFYLNTPPYGHNPAIVNSFSATGGTPNYFDINGKRIEPLVRKRPDFVAPDGGNTSFFAPYPGADIPQDADAYPNFFGTSAAAPHAAGVAALMLEAGKGKNVTPDKIREILNSTASDMDDIYTLGFDKGYDFNTGYGFINAYKAVGEVVDSLVEVNKADKLIASIAPLIDNTANNKAEVYPNPFVQTFTVTLSLAGKGPVLMDLFNVDGKKLQSKIVYQTKGSVAFDAAGYQPGVYVLKIYQGNYTKIMKLIKQ